MTVSPSRMSPREQRPRELVVDLVLHEPAQRTRPVDRVVAALGEPGAGIRRDRERQPALGEPLLEPVDVERHDLAEVVGGERREHHDVVEAVDELGLERLAHQLVAPRPSSAPTRGSGRSRNWLPRFEVRIRIVLRKSTVRPWPSVSRPSSSTCSSTSNTSGCAFSTSSSRITEYGRRRTASVSWPPCS